MLGSEQSKWPGKHFSFSQEKGQATLVLQQYRVSPGSGELCQLSSEVRLGPGEAKAFLATTYMKMNFQSRGRFHCSAFSGLYSMKVQSGCCLSRASCRQLLSPHTLLPGSAHFKPQKQLGSPSPFAKGLLGYSRLPRRTQKQEQDTWLTPAKHPC